MSMESNNRVYHCRSNGVLSDGSPKKPNVDDINCGEIFINYKSGVESFFIKNDDGEIINISKYEILKEINDYYDGSQTVNGVSNIPVNKRLVFCNFTSGATLSLSSSLASSGHNELHIMLHNTSSNDIVITLPNTGTYVNLTEDHLTIASGGYKEVNIISDGTNDYIRSI